MLIKKVTVSALCAVLLIVFTGCSYVKVNEERDNAQVVAEVNGTKILKSEYKKKADNILSNVNMSQESLKNEKNAADYKQYVLDTLVQQELMLQEAQKQGLVNLSDEHIKDIEKEQSDLADKYYSLYLQLAEQNGATDPKSEALKNWNQYLNETGLINLNESAIDKIKSEAITELYEQKVGNIEIPEDEVKKYYEEQVAQQEDLVKSDPSNYQFYKNLSQAFVNPENSRYVKNLLIKLPDNITSQISELRTAGDDIAADKLRSESLKEIQNKAEDALKRVKNGEDFDAVISEIGEDPGMLDEPNKTFGYLVVEDGTDYVQEFQDAAMSLVNVGDISDLVPTDFGYHIIKYQNEGSGPVNFEILKDELTQNMLNTKKNEIISQFLEELKSASQIKTFIDRV